jgi:hypothetical protein
MLQASDSAANDAFGSSVALGSSGFTVVVGAPTSVAANPGAVYIYYITSSADLFEQQVASAYQPNQLFSQLLDATG